MQNNGGKITKIKPSIIMVTFVYQCKNKVLNVMLDMLKDVALKKEVWDEEKYYAHTFGTINIKQYLSYYSTKPGCNAVSAQDQVQNHPTMPIAGHSHAQSRLVSLHAIMPFSHGHPLNQPLGHTNHHQY